MGLRQHSPYVGWAKNKMVAPINVLTFEQRHHHQGTNIIASKDTQSCSL